MEFGDGRAIKIVLVGDPVSGRTSLVRRTGAFDQSDKSPIVVHFMVKTMNIIEKSVSFQVWNTTEKNAFALFSRLMIGH